MLLLHVLAVPRGQRPSWVMAQRLEALQGLPAVQSWQAAQMDGILLLAEPTLLVQKQAHPVPLVRIDADVPMTLVSLHP